MATGKVAKDIHSLLRKIDSISGGQAKVLEWDSDSLKSLKVEVAPADGYYKNGRFKFKIDIDIDNYPQNPPNVNCLTPIYHPNIDTISDELFNEDEKLDPEEGNFDSSNICLNIFTDWDPGMNLEDCIQGLLFLFYNPNFEDPLTPVFDATSCFDMDEFEENVRLSLLGGNVEGIEFKTNSGLAEACDVVKYVMTDLIDQVFLNEDIEEIVDEKGEVLQNKNETKQLTGAEVLCHDILSDLVQQICVENETEQKCDRNNDIKIVQEEGKKVQEELNNSEAKVDEIREMLEPVVYEGKVVEIHNPEQQNSDSREVQAYDKTVEAIKSEQGCSTDLTAKDRVVAITDGDLYSEVKDLNTNENIINAFMTCDNKKLVLHSDSYIEKCNNVEKPLTSNL